jgi:hypothetical protein
MITMGPFLPDYTRLTYDQAIGLAMGGVMVRRRSWLKGEYIVAQAGELGYATTPGDRRAEWELASTVTNSDFMRVRARQCAAMFADVDRQHINTAPRDGSYVVIGSGDGRRAFLMRWNPIRIDDGGKSGTWECPFLSETWSEHFDNGPSWWAEYRRRPGENWGSPLRHVAFTQAAGTTNFGLPSEYVTGSQDSSAMKILFFGIDGVLNDPETPGGGSSPRIDRSKVELLNTVAACTRCQVVTISAWRRGVEELAVALKMVLRDHGLQAPFHVAWRTPQTQLGHRSHEIMFWLERYLAHGARYAIVTANIDELTDDQIRHAVQTTIEGGADTSAT